MNTHFYEEVDAKEYNNLFTNYIDCVEIIFNIVHLEL